MIHRPSPRGQGVWREGAVTPCHLGHVLIRSPTDRSAAGARPSRSDRSSRPHSRRRWSPRAACPPRRPARASRPAAATDRRAAAGTAPSVSRRALVVMRLTRQWRYIRAIRKSLITWLASAIGGLNATTFCFARRIASASFGVQLRQPPARLRDQVGDHHVDHPPDRLVPQPRRRHVQAGHPRRGQRLAHHRQMRDLLRPEQPRAQAVVQVVAVIGDVVGQRRDLRLGAGMRVAGPAYAGRCTRRCRPADCAAGRCAWPGPPASPRSGSARPSRRSGSPAASPRAGSARCGRSRRTASSPGSAPPRRHGRTADGRGRAPAPAPRSGPRPARARGRSSGRSAPPRSNGSAGCGRNRPRG